MTLITHLLWVFCVCFSAALAASIFIKVCCCGTPVHIQVTACHRVVAGQHCLTYTCHGLMELHLAR